MAGSGRSNVGTAVVAVIALLAVALPQALLATTQECEETETAGLWTCAPGVTWEESGQTVSENLTVLTPGDSATVEIKTDFHSTQAYSASTSPSVTVIETANETLNIIPRLNLVKIQRDGETEHLLASEDPDAKYEVPPDIEAIGLEPRDPTCDARIFWEAYYVDVDPALNDPSPDVTVTINGSFTEYDTHGFFVNYTEFGGEEEETRTGNPLVWSGNESYPWTHTEDKPAGENKTGRVHYHVEFRLAGSGWPLDTDNGDIYGGGTTECGDVE